MSIGSTRVKSYSLPLKVSREDLENLPPLEKIFAEHLIKTKPGQVFLIVDGDAE